ncbi:Myb-like DNA-binding domain containing protein [Trichomonas vaginalis G3]|uniref:Myb-like DNA-binding domain containing protein n=1 Tax=Trichomonas vaginalis (strain ATCC PRA-98 / G3) TaxID=412133 RepID=A2FCK3_TRIV3|nr:RNA polymerase II transcription regulator recruiting protein [Trichomonas vaginalis G3]EAX97362.1 Myb-like DNA-binding domain containing protein [Trichomonas vaginalis G3]KAI5496522.1 RNA polymerase II transcription regulator recruiting protein [Trichomonas vaginalis G3]|eukprot:XP_001310292.1 Myb-like DNA-binding domain containing protein [Trichomonas vaginalis G3]
MTRIPSIFELQLPSNTISLFNGINSHQPVSIKAPEEKSYNLKGLWSPKEDENLKKAISTKRGPISWDEIAKFVPGRSPKQCRERWTYRLCPNVNKAPFERWEDEFIIIEREKIGNRWTEIAAKLPGRTSCAIKNRWYTVLKNRISNGYFSTFNYLQPQNINQTCAPQTTQYHI